MLRSLRTALEAVTAFAIPASWFVGLLALACIHRTDITMPEIVIKREAPTARFVAQLPEGVKHGSKKATGNDPKTPPKPKPEQKAESQASDTQAAITKVTPHTRSERSTTQHAAIAVSRAKTGDGQASDRSRSARAASGGQKKGRKCEADDPRVAQLDTYEYAVDIGVLDYYSTHLAEADALAFTSWHRDADGRVDGFKVRGMGCGNILRQSGFRNGDIIHRINDQEIRTLKDALRAYKRLRSSRVLRLTVTRKDGSRVKLKYKLR